VHRYLAEVARDCECEAYRVGGVADHVHLALRLARTVSQAELLEKLKTTSSKWVKTLGPLYDDFGWQRGYGDFSVGFSQLERLCDYIDRQEAHHKRVTFEEEYRMLLKKYNLPFDERYVWD